MGAERLMSYVMGLRSLVMGLRSLSGVGDVAKSEYVRLCNQERHHIQLIPDPVGRRLIAGKTPAKWAVIQVLSTKVWLALANIEEILKDLGYVRKKTTLRSALRRLVMFGLAVRQPFYRTTRVGWRLTELGRQLPLKPTKKANPMFIETQVLENLKKLDEWTYPTKLAADLNISRKSAGGALRKLFSKGKVIRQAHPTTKGAVLYTLADNENFTSNWPIPVMPARATPNKQPHPDPTKYSIATLPDRSSSMCLPNKPTLVKAVTEVVNEKISKHSAFSAHDITKILRGKVADPNNKVDIDIAETGNVFVKGVAVIRIAHEDVREVVNHLYNTSAMPGYTREFNGTYLEFKPLAVSKIQTDPGMLKALDDPDPTVLTFVI